MTDSVDALGAATGLRRDTLLEIWGEVKANNAVLNACPRHDFMQEQPGKLGSKWRCSACGGHVTASDAHWYNLGRSHG